jgi:hypothetical protein
MSEPYVKCINIACSDYCLNGTCAENKINCIDRDTPIVDFIDEKSNSIHKIEQQTEREMGF